MTAKKSILKSIYILKTIQIQTSLFTSSAQYQEIPHQKSLILGSFHVRGNRVGLKRSLDAFFTVVFTAANMIATCWNLRRRITQKENMRTNASKGFFKPIQCHQQLFSLRIQGDRRTLNRDPEREVPNDGVYCFKLLYSHVPIPRG